MPDILEQISQRMGELSQDERDTLKRIMSGAADRDLIRRGAAQAAIREEILASVSLPEECRYQVQRALQSALRRVGHVKAVFEA